MMAQRDELLHDHDHVDMITAMRRYAGSAPLPGTALPPC